MTFKAVLIYFLATNQFSVLPADNATAENTVRSWVINEYKRYANPEPFIKQYLQTGEEREGDEWLKKKSKFESTAAEFRRWVKENKFEFLLKDESIVVINYYLMDDFAGFVPRKQPVIFLQKNNSWVVASVDMDRVEIFDLNGDSKADVLWHNACCGGEVIGAYINRGKDKPFETNTAFWRRGHQALRLNEVPTVKPCSGETERYRPAYTPIRYKYDSCEKFRIDFSVKHCNQMQNTHVGFDCKKNSFSFGTKPFE
jgi:hypothetical protein